MTATDGQDPRSRALRAEAALRELVTLKDGPRDEDYERRKPLAWQTARDILDQVAQARDVDTSRQAAAALLVTLMRADGEQIPDWLHLMTGRMP